MNYYKLSAVVNDNEINVKKHFKTRKQAMDYAFKLLDREYVFDSEIEESYEMEGKHDIEYALNNANSFRIARSSN